MIERQNKKVQDYLSATGHKLEPGEKIIHLMINHNKFSKLWRSVFPVFMILLFIFLNLIGHSGLFIGLVCICVFTMVLLVSTVTMAIKDKSLGSNKTPTFGLITSKGIRAGQQFIPWKQIYDIKVRYINGLRYLVFDLNPNHKDYQLYNRPVNNSYTTPSFIFLGNQYDADHLLSEITPFWEPVSPNHQLKVLSEKLKDTYQLGLNSSGSLNGSYKSFKLQHCKYDSSFPIKEISTSLNLPNPITAFLKIGMESGTSAIKQAVVGKDIQIGHPSIDNLCLFESNNPQELQQLFTAEVIAKFQELIQLGTVNWSFGTPIKKKQLKNKQSSIEDDEAILDVGMLKPNQQTSVTPQSNLPTSNRLDFSGILDDRFKNNPEKAKVFFELSMQMTVLLGEHLNDLQEE